ncbi:ankyrin repeat domain-containing protein 6 isoform X2 [Cimex lectularius]|uniref:Ankyrin repeat domain-containing protein 6 n=1 Tax=Cimex lectularius TaxID=79782 RepID=A0A8I6SLE7_CIMLE|nr:ankyrin repeat domain-containing protein 6 isoform X2 [Cimex lectularius]
MLEEELRSAAARGILDDVNSLLKRGANFAPDSCGRTPLHLASAAGFADVVDLLANPENINDVDAVGRTSLQIAATGGHLEVVRILLKKGGNPNLRDELHGNTPVHEASWHGFSQTVALLVRNGAESGIKNIAGFAAIHLACQNGHNQSCRELLLAGADPDIQNNYGDTALHTSARYGHAGVARILISASCRVSDQNKNGDTALHIASAMGRRKLTTILLEAGCDKSIRNKQYETACDIATRKDLNEIIIILQSVKPQKSSKKKSKKTSETSDSDKRSRETLVGRPHDPRACGSSVRWSPYGCHYYPDPKAFPQPKLDSLPGEPLSKGEQYYLDLAGNIRKGPVGVGLTCYCTNFLRDMEARLERSNEEMKQRIRSARCHLEERVERTEGLIAEWLEEGRGRSRKKKKKKSRSQSLDLLENTTKADRKEESDKNEEKTSLFVDRNEEMAEVEETLKELSVRAEQEENKNKALDGSLSLSAINLVKASDEEKVLEQLKEAEKSPLGLKHKNVKSKFQEDRDMKWDTSSYSGIEALPYRSRVAVYNPAFSGFTGQNWT